MANNYTFFAEVLKMPAAAATYAVELETLCNELEDDKLKDLDALTCGLDESMLEDAKDILGGEDDPPWYGTGSYLEAVDGGLYVHSGESGDLETLVNLVHIVMRRHDVRRPVSFEWAHTCDKPRPGEFGGGAVVITQHETYWFSTGQFVASTIERLAKEVTVGFD